MHRVDTSTAVAVKPAPDAPGTPGYFRRGNPTAGHLATVPGPDWFNDKQEELCTIVERAGLPLNKSDHTLLWQALRRLFLSTGDVKMTFKTVADPGWILLTQDGSIGAPGSGATVRANNDTVDLFTLFWGAPYTTVCPMQNSAGSPVARGASAAADFAANRRIVIPKMLGRVLAVAGQGSFESVFTANAGTDLLSIDSNSSIYTGATVRVSNTGGALPAPLAINTDYFAIRVSPTTMRLATTRLNALAGTYIDLTTAGTGAHLITMTFTNRAAGSIAGEESHVQTLTELVPHAHELNGNQDVLQAGANSTMYGPGGLSDQSTRSAGGGEPMNILQPTTFGNVMICL